MVRAGGRLDQLRIGFGNCILCDMGDDARNRAVARELERFQFDAHSLAGAHEADITVGKIGLDAEGWISRHDPHDRCEFACFY